MARLDVAYGLGFLAPIVPGIVVAHIAVEILDKLPGNPGCSIVEVPEQRFTSE